MKRFYLLSLCSLVCLFFNIGLVKAGFEILDLVVVDTVLGEDTFYSFEKKTGELPSGKYDLALRKPDLKIVEIAKVDFERIDLLKPYRIDASDLKEAGRYDLLLLQETEYGREIVLRDEFFVNQSVASVDVNDMDLSEWLQANLFGVGGDEDLINSDNRFGIEDLPDSIDKDVPLTFTLKALNENKDVDINYSGTVSIQVLNDVNAVVPTDYTYVLQDAGEHKFVEGIVFTSAGEKTIRIEDIDDASIFAEIEVLVTEDVGQGEETLLKIESPVSGVVSNNRVLVKGVTEPGLEVIVLESGVEFVRFDADVDGSFTELLPALEDGVYKIALKVNEKTSNEITLEIDTGGVGLRSFDLTQSNVSPSSIVGVEVELNKESSSVSVILNGVKTDLDRKDIAGTFFEGQITAPITDGTYPISLLVVDELGNSENINAEKSLIVSSGEVPKVEEEVTDENVNSDVVDIVSLEGESGDKQVLLKWNSVNDSDVVFYSIRYGLAANNMDKMVDTNGAVSQWYVPGLLNDVEYFFTVSAVDRDGNEKATTNILTVVPGRPGDTSMFGDNVEPEETSDTGPELLLVLFLAFFLSGAWRYRFDIMRKLLP